MPLDEKTILERVARHPGPEYFEFGLENLVGQKIVGIRSIDREKDQSHHTYPGRYMQVVDFESGLSLVWYEEGMQDYSVHHVYCMGPSPDDTRYRQDIFKPDMGKLG